MEDSIGAWLLPPCELVGGGGGAWLGLLIAADLDDLEDTVEPVEEVEERGCRYRVVPYCC